ncbi:MAG: FecR family protein [Bacteroidota bacterium]|nr:FecR family protein [Bacteroidota bacterium]
MNHPKRIGTLLFRHTRNELTDKEKKELAEWRALSAENEQLFRDKTDPQKVRASMTELYDNRDQVFQKIKDKHPELANAKLSNHDFPESGSEGKQFRLFHLSRRAAVITLLAGISLYVLLRSTGLLTADSGNTYDAVFVTPEGIEPSLDDFHRGFYAGFAGINFKRNEKGELDYIASNNIKKAKNKNYSLRSSKKGHFKLNLPDCGWIWFHSATSIDYPANLSQDTIHINVKGEAYFELKRDSSHPFIIDSRSSVNGQRSSNNLEIQVESSNAHFNVNAYPDSSTMLITAIKGNLFLRMNPAVGISKSEVHLIPGQQAKITGGEMTVVQNVDVNKILAWTKW